MWDVGQRVRATRIVTEGGRGYPGDPGVKMNDPYPCNLHYIHALAGELGVVEFVDEHGNPDVRFDRTGTATIVGDDEIELVEVIDE